MKKLIIFIVVLFLVLIVGGIILYQTQVSSFANKEMFDYNFAHINNPKKSISTNSDEAFYCLSLIRSASKGEEYSSCDFVSSELLDQNQFFSDYQEGARFLVKCKCLIIPSCPEIIEHCEKNCIGSLFSSMCVNKCASSYSECDYY